MVITDLDMGPEDGVSLWTWVAAERPELKGRLIGFSARQLPARLAAVGAVYLPKPSPLAEVWAAIQTMMAT